MLLLQITRWDLCAPVVRGSGVCMVRIMLQMLGNCLLSTGTVEGVESMSTMFAAGGGNTVPAVVQYVVGNRGATDGRHADQLEYIGDPRSSA